MDRDFHAETAETNTRYVCLLSIDFVWTNAPVLAGYHYIPLLVEDHDHRYHGCELSGGERERSVRQARFGFQFCEVLMSGAERAGRLVPGSFAWSRAARGAQRKAPRQGRQGHLQPRPCCNALPRPWGLPPFRSTREMTPPLETMGFRWR